METSYYGVGSRQDKFFQGTVGVTYQFNTHASIAAGYTYRGNQSNQPVGFSDDVFSVVASLRF